ncbi:flagellar export protein FliJ [Desulforamulus ferrireducens]|uniref:Flagellar FliJ protein n=1 Tax=Desulforamulus ferrireducens TaxID=1833852 RepID=A0A1S6IYI9_9FIRM|nr:flagellar export protein FliJ [Desulforamulus ferrireducens]AQS59820.1 flagellar export protein FliJ [Desulforamulus ferrireducens]
MAKFLFRLEQVLEQRIKAEEKALLELAKAQQECTKIEKSLAATEDKLQQAFSYAGTISHPSEQMQSFIYVEHLKQTVERQRRLLLRAKEILELRKKEVLDAKKDRMILEKLKEKQFIEYKELEMYIEQKEIDELATLGFARANNS